MQHGFSSSPDACTHTSPGLELTLPASELPASECPHWSHSEWQQRQHCRVSRASRLIEQLRPQSAGGGSMPERSFSEKPASCCLKLAWEMLGYTMVSSSRTGSTGRSVCRRTPGLFRDRAELASGAQQGNRDSFCCSGDKEIFPRRLASCADWKTKLEDQ